MATPGRLTLSEDLTNFVTQETLDDGREALGPIVVSDVTDITGASRIINVVSLSQDDYDDIVTPDPNTLYVISD